MRGQGSDAKLNEDLFLRVEAVAHQVQWDSRLRPQGKDCVLGP